MLQGGYLLRVGLNITRLRKAQGLTSKELGYDCDMDKSDIIRIEKGRQNTTITTLSRIAQALKVDISELFKPLPNGQ